MSRAAQEMQRIADEMKKARRQPTKKGRQPVDELEDITNETPAQAQEPAPAAAATAPPEAAAEQEQPVARAKKAKKAKSASAIRSAKWRAKQKKAAAGAPQAGDRASVKAQGSGDVKTVFVTTTVDTARRAFNLLLVQLQQENAGKDPQEAQNAVADVQRIVNRLGA